MTRPVYLVDDEEAIRRSASLLLRVTGFQPVTFEDGKSFLAAEASLESGCALLDIRMPDVDGIAVQRKLQLRESAHVSVVMTGHGDIASAVAALSCGAVAFVEKPFSKDQLLSALEIAFMKLEEPERYREFTDAAQLQLASLAEQERSVLELIAADCSKEDILARLNLTPPELATSQSLIQQHLGVDSIPAALSVAFAARQAG